MAESISRSSAPTECHVLTEDPDLGEVVDVRRRERAVHDCVARCIRLARGRWDGTVAGGDENGIGLLVLEGLILRRVGIEGRYGAELLGEGDLLRPWDDIAQSSMLSATSGWRVLQSARVAVLDSEAARCFSAYPELTGRLVSRAVARSRHLTVNMAIVHQARVDVRLRMLFWHLAGRWGRVGRGGVILPLALTHAVLADLVAARRPTVTTALAELARRRLIVPGDAGWMLYGEPPGELLEIEPVDVISG
jgi:CRP-like cAMP-binding protein